MITFTLYAKPFSVNSAYYKRGNRTVECREWGDEILFALLKPSIAKKLGDFRDGYNASEMQIAVTLTFNIPRDKFFTKKGEVNLQTKDLSNVEKLLIDLIFDRRFNGREVNGKTARNLDINDKQICSLLSRKLPTDSRQYSIDVTIDYLNV